MGEAAMDQRLYGNCTVCGAAIRRGDELVSVSRTVERVNEEGDVDVESGEWLASLCAKCAPRYPATAIRVTFTDKKDG